MTRRHRHAFNAKRIDGTSWDPAELTLVTDPKDPLYDKHIEEEVPDDAVLNMAAVGVIQPIVIKKRGDDAVVIDGHQRTKRALIINALIGRPYKGKIQAVHDAIERMNTKEESKEVAKRVVVYCPDGIMVPAVARNRGDDALARAVKASAQAFRRNEDPVAMAADEAQRHKELGRSPEAIAESMRLSVATVKRYLKMDLSKPRAPKKKRGKATRPNFKQLVAWREKTNGELTKREICLLDWLMGVRFDVNDVYKAFDIKIDE